MNALDKGAIRDQSSHNASSLSILGVFKDKYLENEFLDDFIKRSIRSIRAMIFALGILFLLFIVPDYFLIKDKATFNLMLASRILFLAAVSMLYVKSRNIIRFSRLTLWLTLCEIFGGISFLVIVTQYESPNFFIQVLGTIIVVMAVFLVPNRIYYALTASLLVTGAFVLLTTSFKESLSPAEYSAGLVYLFIILILCIVTAAFCNYYNRKQYAYSKELWRMSMTDPLTGIYNRKKFDEELKKWISYAKRYRHPFTVMVFDFDDFKGVNDTFGHVVGDKVIAQAVDIVRHSIRDADVLARWGGEEFLLLLPHTQLEQGVELAERLRKAIAAHVFETAGHVTCSFGLAGFEEGDDAESLIERADTCLYQAKHQGKNMLAY